MKCLFVQDSILSEVRVSPEVLLGILLQETGVVGLVLLGKPTPRFRSIPLLLAPAEALVLPGDVLRLLIKR